NLSATGLPPENAPLPAAQCRGVDGKCTEKRCLRNARKCPLRKNQNRLKMNATDFGYGAYAVPPHARFCKSGHFRVYRRSLDRRRTGTLMATEYSLRALPEAGPGLASSEICRLRMNHMLRWGLCSA